MLLASSPAINFSMRAFQFSQVSSIVSRSAAVASSASEQHCAHTAEEGCIAPLFFQDEEGTAHANDWACGFMRGVCLHHQLLNRFSFILDVFDDRAEFFCKLFAVEIGNRAPEVVCGPYRRVRPAPIQRPSVTFLPSDLVPTCCLNLRRCPASRRGRISSQERAVSLGRASGKRPDPSACDRRATGRSSNAKRT